MSRSTHSRCHIGRALLFALIATGAISVAVAQDVSSSGSSTHLRSLAVYEYLGSYQKPTRSRLVPVAIWDGTQFQPGSLYLADPTPLSVKAGTLYELMQDGNGVGQVEVMQAEQVGDGWIGLGKYLPNPPAGPKFKLPASLTAKAKFESDKPHFAYKPPASTGVAGGKAEASKGGPVREGSGAESGRPTLENRPELTPGPSDASATTPSEEGRPVLHQPEANSQTAPPTLHRRTEAQQLGSQAAPPSGRPILGYNTHAASPVTQLKQDALTGHPPEVHEMVAISDVDGTTDHSYAWEWSSPGDKAAALKKVEALALQYLTTAKPSDSTNTETKAEGKAAQVKRHRGRAEKSSPVAAPQPVTLTDEQFHAFELDFGSGPVYVFSARTSAPEESTTYITLIAQPDFAGGIIPLYKSITPAQLLDYEPRLKLVDAVDATGSGRADLLFDVIRRRSREFALFSVQNGQAQEVFYTGQQ
ncbi:MAG: hypothetical protein ACP5M4_12130 [Acidobacteriaceae bacterium]